MFSPPKMKVEEENDRIYELFSAFDTTNNDTIAVSDIPVLIRVLGLKEADIQPLLKNWTDKNDERVTYENFLPVYHALKEKYEKKTNNPDAASISSMSSNNRFADRVVSMPNLKEATKVPPVTTASATSESSQSNETKTIILLLKAIAVLLFFLLFSYIWFNVNQIQTMHSGSSMKELSEIRKMVVSLESKFHTLIVFNIGLIGGFVFRILLRGNGRHETEKNSKAHKQCKKTHKDSKKEIKQNIINDKDKEQDENDENKEEAAENLGEYHDIQIKVTRVGLLFFLKIKKYSNMPI